MVSFLNVLSLQLAEQQTEPGAMGAESSGVVEISVPLPMDVFSWRQLGTQNIPKSPNTPATHANTFSFKENEEYALPVL